MTQQFVPPKTSVEFNNVQIFDNMITKFFSFISQGTLRQSNQDFKFIQSNIKYLICVVQDHNSQKYL